MTQAIATIVALLILFVVILSVWLATARKQKIQAEAATKALEGAQELESAGNKVMAEPVADEPAWIAGARERLRERDRES